MPTSDSRDDPGGGMSEAVRAVTRAVVGRLGHAGPDVIEAVVTEVLASLGGAAPAAAPSTTRSVTTPRGASLAVVGAEHGGPSFDVCALCIEQEKSRTRRRAVLTTTGKNQKGIVARITARIADLGGDILDISQTLVGEWFTMIIVIDAASLSVSYQQFQEDLQATIRDLGCQVMMMHEDVLASFHRV